MRRGTWWTQRTWTIAAPALLVLAAATRTSGSERAPARDDALVERGRHIVHDVAMCVQCHSARDGAGDLIEDRLLAGGVIPVENPYPSLAWGQRAPYLRSEPGYDEDALVRLLTTGVTARGGTPRAPMPPFRMSVDEARAVYAYLASLE